MRLRLKTYLVSKNVCLTKQQPLIWKKKTRNFLIYLMSKHSNSFGFTTIGIKKNKIKIIVIIVTHEKVWLVDKTLIFR